MENQIKALVKFPGKKAKEMEITNTLECLQQLVGGYIEVVQIATDLAAIVNEEGILENLHYKRDICGHHLFGNIIIVGIDGEEFSSVSYDAKVIETVLPQLFEVESST